jgi:hypothetical protein
MRQMSFGFRFPGEDFEPWAERAFREIENGSIEDAITIADSYTLGTFTPTRALPNTGTITATQLGNVFATFIDDLQKRSVNRAE